MPRVCCGKLHSLSEGEFLGVEMFCSPIVKKIGIEYRPPPCHMPEAAVNDKWLKLPYNALQCDPSAAPEPPSSCWVASLTGALHARGLKKFHKPATGSPAQACCPILPAALLTQALILSCSLQPTSIARIVDEHS